MDPYIYQPLDQPASQIRLLHLIPGDENDEISCTISTHELDSSQCPEYSAISYTWGDARPQRSIIVDGLRFLVGLNCWYALWQMRYHKLWDILWIDAICIDQQHNAEKGAQVPMMGRIYNRAQSVAACVGPGDELERGDFKGLGVKPYFSRLWIKQEFLLAKKLVLFCGLGYADSQDLYSTMDEMTRPATWNDDLSSRDSSGDIEILLEDRRSGVLSAMTASLGASQDSLRYLDLLVKYSGARCQDPRDKLYGLLSLVWPSNPPILLSYDATLADVGSSFLTWVRSAWKDYVQQPDDKNYHHVKLIPRAAALVRDAFDLKELPNKATTLTDSFENSHLVAPTRNKGIYPFYLSHSISPLQKITMRYESLLGLRVTPKFIEYKEEHLGLCSIDVYVAYLVEYWAEYGSVYEVESRSESTKLAIQTSAESNWGDCQIVIMPSPNHRYCTLLVNSSVRLGDMIFTLYDDYDYSKLYFIARRDTDTSSRAELISCGVVISTFFASPEDDDYHELERRILEQFTNLCFPEHYKHVYKTYNILNLHQDELFALVTNSCDPPNVVKRAFSSPTIRSFLEIGPEREDLIEV